MPFSYNCNLLKEEIFILEKNNLFTKRGKKETILLEVEDKEQWKLSEKQKGIEKKENFTVRRTLQKGTMAFWSHSRSFIKGHETTTHHQSEGISLTNEQEARQRRGHTSCCLGCAS